MIDVSSITIATRALAPLIKDIYDGAKKVGAKGFTRWEASSFPKNLARKLIRVESVRPLWQVNKTVSVRGFYYPLSIYEDASDPRQVENLASFGAPHVVIEGIVGQGKSILLRYLCVQELLHQGLGLLPLFIELRAIKPGKSLQQHIMEELASYDISDETEAFDFLARSSKLILLLDGFDELDDGLAGEVIRFLERLIEKYPQLRILITSRPECEIQASPSFKIYQLSKITDESHVDFLCKMGFSRTEAITIASAIKESPNEISELITTPLMLTLTVMVYRSEKAIPSMLPAFFEALFTTVFTRHDKTKPGFERRHSTGLGERSLQLLFELFCFVCAQAGQTRTLTAEEFATCYERASKFHGDKTPSLEDFKFDVSKVACLLLEEGIGEMTFLHKSVAEFFAASFVRRLQEKHSEKFYEGALANYGHWRGILQFLTSIDIYRFNKYYLIPERNRFLEKIKNGEGNITDASIRRYIDKYLGDVIIEIGKAKGVTRIISSRMEPSLSSLWSTAPTESNFINEIISGFLRNLPESFDVFSEIDGLYVMTDSEMSDAKNGRTTLKMLFKEMGYNSFVSAGKVAVNKIEREIAHAEATIESEDKKIDIFDHLI